MSAKKKSPTRIAIENALAEGRALRARQLEQETGYSYDGVCNALCKMRGMIYIASWERIDAWHWVPVYRLGAEMDALKPEPLSDIEIDRLRRRRLGMQERRMNKVSEIDLDVHLELERARKAREALSRPAFRHPHDIAFFGEFNRMAA